MSPRARGAAWILVAVMLAGLAGGALTSGSVIPAGRSETEAPDAAPEAAALARTPTPNAVGALAATGFIAANGQQPAQDGTAGPPAPEVWILRGIATGASPSAMFQTAPDAPPKSLGVGDALPDGRKIAAIEPDRVRLESGSCRSEIRLFSPLVPADCPSPPAATQ